MSGHTVTADMLALDAASAGEHIWRAVELAYAQGATKAVDAFEATLQTLRQSFPEYYAGKLFEAAAMNAITQMVDAKRSGNLTELRSDPTARAEDTDQVRTTGGDTPKITNE